MNYLQENLDIQNVTFHFGTNNFILDLSIKLLVRGTSSEINQRLSSI